MKKFVYEYPTKVYFGEGAAKEHLAAAVSPYGTKVLLAYGGGSVKKNGIYEQVVSILEGAGKKVFEVSGIMSNPTYAKVQEGAALAKREHIDLILAVGGGSVIDCCKIVAAQAKTDADLWELEMEKSNITGYWIGVLTERGDETGIDFTECVKAKKWFMKPFVKSYLRKQQAQFVADIRKALGRM